MFLHRSLPLCLLQCQLAYPHHNLLMFQHRFQVSCRLLVQPLHQLMCLHRYRLFNLLEFQHLFHHIHQLRSLLHFRLFCLLHNLLTSLQPSQLKFQFLLLPHNQHMFHHHILLHCQPSAQRPNRHMYLLLTQPRCLRCVQALSQRMYRLHYQQLNLLLNPLLRLHMFQPHFQLSYQQRFQPLYQLMFLQ